MSIFGSLFTAVSGLSAQSDAISMISNNIANVSTIGYKEVNASFESLVTTSSNSTAYSPGSVIADQSQTINQQGILQQSSSPTDMAISGNGFFVVKSSTTDALAAPLYTRAGSFTENSDGDLVNTAGYYLQGWPLGDDGAPPTNQANISSLVPVNVAFLGGLTQPTSTASIDLNLDSSATNVAYPVPSGTAPSYSTAVQVYDSLGTGNNLNINLTKMASPTSSITGTTDLSSLTGDIAGNTGFTGVQPTDTFTIQVKNAAGADINNPLTGPNNTTSSTGTITLSGTVANMLAQINAITDPITNTPLVNAQINANGQLSITANNLGDTITLADTAGDVGDPLGATGTGLGFSPQFQSQALGTLDTSGFSLTDLTQPPSNIPDTDTFTVKTGANPATTIDLNGGMTKLLSDLNNVPGLTASIDSATGFLDLKSSAAITLADGVGTPLADNLLGLSAGASAVTGLIPAPSQSPSLLTPLGATTPDADGWWNVSFTTPSGSVISQGAINFLGNGQLNATPQTDGTVPVSLKNINWGDDSESQNITFNMAGFTQFASDYDVVSSTQNGAALGLQTGISINSDGFVVAQFSNGQSQNIYQLPIATFANPNGLNASSGNVYTQSDASGTYNLRESGTGGAGTISGGELEASNVDLATEFAQMIVTQQAYSANSKVITTADQMTQDLLQITG